MPTFAYNLLGRTVHSELELPELEPDRSESRVPDIRIRWGQVDGPKHCDRPEQTPYRVDRERCLVDKPGTARYGITGGHTITVDAYDHASEPDVRAFLLGSVFGALCHQRALLPLHAGAVASGDRCLAFAGSSGTGKSTLASGLLDRGFTFVADDICPIDIATGAEPTVLPGIPRLKLAADSLTALGRGSSSGILDQEDPPKYHERVQRCTAQPVKLSAIYMFDDNLRSPGALSIYEISPTRAVRCVEQLTYMPLYPRLAGSMVQHFRRCAYVADRVPLFLVFRRPDLARLSGFLDAIAEHAQSKVGP